jgi:hypothetical protein
MIERATLSKRANQIAGVLLCAAIAMYLFNFQQQVKGVQEFCKAYTVGSSIANIEDFPWNKSVKLRGPITSSTGQTSYIACSDYSMCDIACIINFKDQTVTERICENCGI